MIRRNLWIVVVVVGAVIPAAWWMAQRGTGAWSPAPEPPERSEAEIRQALFDAVQPVTVSNCELARFGEAHDGGYLMCGNLLTEVRAGYSYGIDGFDGWGCQVSNTLKVPVQQYDCFNTALPTCVADTKFHAECVGPKTEMLEGRFFDTIERQLKKNGDTGKHVVMKLDIEGAEWDSLLHTPDAVLANVDQMAVEFHRINQEKFVQVIEGLKRNFHVAHLHFNNHACERGLDPFPSWAFEVLLVNKRVAVVDAAATATRPHPLDTPSNTTVPDCQAIAH
jgi:hypothetical protein